MNLILFAPEEVGRVLARGDGRAAHLLTVLRRQPGDNFDAGIVNGARGKGRIVAVTDAGIEWSFEATPGGSEAADALLPVELLVGMPRPQTARKILQEATALGVRALRFVRTEKGDAGYARSTLWSSGEWRRHVRAGLEQAFAAREPLVTFGGSLAEAWAEMGPMATAWVLDNYEAGEELGAGPVSRAPAAIAIGGERGWSGAERDFFRAQGATLVHLGPRVLRTETACVAAIAVVRSRLVGALPQRGLAFGA